MFSFFFGRIGGEVLSSVTIVFPECCLSSLVELEERFEILRLFFSRVFCFLSSLVEKRRGLKFLWLKFSRVFLSSVTFWGFELDNCAQNSFWKFYFCLVTCFSFSLVPVPCLVHVGEVHQAVGQSTISLPCHHRTSFLSFSYQADGVMHYGQAQVDQQMWRWLLTSLMQPLWSFTKSIPSIWQSFKRTDPLLQKGFLFKSLSHFLNKPVAQVMWMWSCRFLQLTHSLRKFEQRRG